MKWYKDITELKSFVYGAISSTSFKYAFEADNLSPFEKDFELKEIPGRNGDLIIDNKRQKNKIITVKGSVDCDGIEARIVSKKLKDWLCKDIAYKPLTFSDDLTKYEAIVFGVKIVEGLRGLLDVEFKFSAKEVVE